MKDFTRTLQDYCNANDISYHYGSRADLNLMFSDAVVGQVYLFQEIFTRDPTTNSTKTNYVNENFNGRMSIVVKSNLDQHYFNEKGTDETTSKFTLNIEPLKLVAETLGKSLMCSGLDFDFTWIDISNFLDVNYDGILITYKGTTYV